MSRWMDRDRATDIERYRDGQMDTNLDRYLDGWIEVEIYRDREVQGWMDGQVETRQISRWMDRDTEIETQRQMDGYI